MPTLFVRFALSQRALLLFSFILWTLSDIALANERPELYPIAPQTVVAGQVFIYRVQASDPDGTIPAIRVLNAPAGSAFDDNGDGSRTFRWLPTADTPTETVVIVQAVDTNDVSLISTQRMLLRRDDTFTANVSSADDASDSLAPDAFTSSANNRPELPNIGIQFLNTEEDYQLFIRPTDADNTVPALTAKALPDGASLEDAYDGSRVMQWRPSADQVGRHRVLFVATDAQDQTLVTERLIVFDVSNNKDQVLLSSDELSTDSDADSLATESVQADDEAGQTSEPYFKPIEPPIVDAGQEIVFRVVPVMPDGSAAILHVDRLPSGASFVDNSDGTRTFRWQTSETDSGSEVFRFTAIHPVNVDQRVITEVRVRINGQNSDTPSLPEPSPQSVPETNPDTKTDIDTGQIVVPLVPAIDENARASNRAEAARFLQRASFGPNENSVAKLLRQTYADWINDQMSIGQTRYLDRVDAVLREYGLINIIDGRRQFDRQQIRSDAFWDIAVNAPDQLRHRVAFALGQILVVSDKDAGLDNRVRGIANYHDLLASEAFGNYRTLLGKVTLNPMMGDFLSMRRNEKPDISNNIQSDENYARELMQLFTLGLSALNQNGQPILGSNGQPVPTYTQEDVVNLARVFTGWNYGDAASMRTSERSIHSEIQPMKAFEAFHDSDAKRIVGNVDIPAGMSAEDELNFALDAIFNHANVPPFVSRLLIQRLVTSNPSAEYIGRVAAVFADNGQGVRGDLSAVIPAILLDDEALNGYQHSHWSHGKVKEPVVKIASIWRAFDAQGAFGKLRYSGINADFLQSPYSAPSVFNFYSANYHPPGAIANEGKFAPEAQILNDTTILRAADRLFDYAHAVPLGSANNSNQHAMVLNIEAEKALANDVPSLVDHMTEKLLAGSITDNLRATLLELGESTPMSNNGEQRVRELLYVVFISPEFSVQR